MKKMIINGKEITTNYDRHSDYSICTRDYSTMTYEPREWVLFDGAKYKSLEPLEDMLKRLVGYGYSKITFYRETTNVRGLYHYFAYCK